MFRNFRGRVVLLWGLMAILALPGCVNDQKEIEKATRKPKRPVEVSEDIQVLYSDSAVVRVKVEAPLLERYAGPDSYIELPRGVHLTFFDSDGSTSSRLTANYAVSKERERIMEARNDVVVYNKDGDRLNTEHLVWDEKTRKIHTDAFAKITTASEIILGNGMEANEDFSQYKIKDVKGIIQLKKPAHASDT